MYDLATEKWRLIPVVPTVRLRFSVATVNDNFYAFGDYTKDWDLSPTFEMFDTGFCAVEVIGKLTTRWDTLKVEREHQP